MAFEEIQDGLYNISGILVFLFFLLVVISLRKKKTELIKTRIFLKYTQFKTAFYIAFFGSIMFLLGNKMILGLLFDESIVSTLHEIGETFYNVGFAVFVMILYFVLRIPKREI